MRISHWVDWSSRHTPIYAKLLCFFPLWPLLCEHHPNQFLNPICTSHFLPCPELFTIDHVCQSDHIPHRRSVSYAQNNLVSDGSCVTRGANYCQSFPTQTDLFSFSSDRWKTIFKRLNSVAICLLHHSGRLTTVADVFLCFSHFLCSSKFN